MKRRTALLFLPACAILAGALGTVPVHANTGGRSGDFLNLGASARTLGVGGGGAGYGDDVSALTLNPAGLARIAKPELSGFHVSLWEGAVYDFVGAAMPIHRWVAAAGVVRLASGEFDKRDDQFTKTGTFQIGQSAYVLGTARPLGRGVAVGATAKLVRETVADAAASGAGADVGVTWHPRSTWPARKGRGGWLEPLHLGAAVLNAVPPTVTLVSTPERYPASYRVGAAYRVKDPAGRREWLGVSADLSQISGSRVLGRAGLEYWPVQSLSLRTGYGDGRPAAGAGFRYRNYSIDYALGLHDLGLTHRVSALIRFGTTAEDLREFIAGLVDGYLATANRLAANKKFRDARTELDRGLILDPANAALKARLKEFEKLEQEEARRAEIAGHRQRAAAAEKAGRLASALAEWRALLELTPGDAAARAASDRLSARLTAEEKEKLAEALRARRDKEVGRRVEEARKAVAAGRFRDAVLAYQKALSVEPGRADVESGLSTARSQLQAALGERIQRGQDMLKLGQSAAAATEFSRALQLEPADPAARDGLEKARAASRQASAKVPSADLEKRYYQAADAYLKGQYREARDILKQLLDQDPGNENGAKLMDKVERTLEAIGER